MIDKNFKLAYLKIEQLLKVLDIVDKKIMFQEDGGIFLRLIKKSSDVLQTSENTGTEVTTLGANKNGSKEI